MTNILEGLIGFVPDRDCYLVVVQYGVIHGAARHSGQEVYKSPADM